MELKQAETLNKYSFLIKCTDGTVSIASQIGETVEEVQAYVERTLNKEWSLITDTTFIKNWIAKENETRKELKGTEWFWEALDQIEERINKNETENKTDTQSELKTIKQLKNGKCITVASNGFDTKRFESVYDERLQIVFFAMPQRYKVLGYIQ